MKYEPIDMSAFPSEREAGLRGIKRYSMFEVMYYRPTVWEHVHRVQWIIEALAPHAQKFFPADIEKARVMALVHDDAELITGDIPAGHKARMNESQLKKIDDDEFSAIEKLSADYPKSVHGYVYKDLLKETVHYTSNEAKFVSLADKLDAHCESYHEVLAGNLTLLLSMAFYINSLQRMGEKFPLLKEFVRSGAHPLLREMGPLPEGGTIGPKDFAAFNRPHTRESLPMPSRFPFYDAWRGMVVERGGEEGVRWLTEVKESVQ